MNLSLQLRQVKPDLAIAIGLDPLAQMPESRATDLLLGRINEVTGKTDDVYYGRSRRHWFETLLSNKMAAVIGEGLTPCAVCLSPDQRSMLLAYGTTRDVSIGANTWRGLPIIVGAEYVDEPQIECAAGAAA